MGCDVNGGRSRALTLREQQHIPAPARQLASSPARQLASSPARQLAKSASVRSRPVSPCCNHNSGNRLQFRYHVAMTNSELPVAMRPEELVLLRELVSCSRRYVEFGAGGSTCLAAQTVAESVVSVDSSRDWLEKVAAVAIAGSYKIQPALLHADIGALTDWGYPRDLTQRARWPQYHEIVWTSALAANADTYLVDGRFRVACFMQVMLRCQADAIVIVHDFSDRPHYGKIHSVAREIARSANLSAFVRRPGMCQSSARETLEEYRYDPR